MIWCYLKILTYRIMYIFMWVLKEQCVCAHACVQGKFLHDTKETGWLWLESQIVPLFSGVGGCMVFMLFVTLPCRLVF